VPMPKLLSKSLLVVASSSLLLSLGLSGAAQATTKATSSVRVAMTAQCRIADPASVSHKDLSSKAKVDALCAKIGIPGSGAAAPRRVGVRPLNVVSGNCGSSWLYIYNQFNGGTPQFYVGAQSLPAELDYGAATITWQNLTKGGTSIINLAVSPNNDPFTWLDFVSRYTKVGTIFAYMAGDVLLTNGELCYMDYPTDTENVS
jgi:hypothetical protein